MSAWMEAETTLLHPLYQGHLGSKQWATPQVKLKYVIQRLTCVSSSRFLGIRKDLATLLRPGSGIRHVNAAFPSVSSSWTSGLMFTKGYNLVFFFCHTETMACSDAFIVTSFHCYKKTVKFGLFIQWASTCWTLLSKKNLALGREETLNLTSK